MLNRTGEILGFQVGSRASSWIVAVGVALAVICASSPHAAPFAYITNDSNNVSVVDTATNTVIATIPVGNSPVGVAVDPAGRRVYVANSSDNNVSVINIKTKKVRRTIPVGTDPEGIAVNPAGTRIYVTNNQDSSVSVIGFKGRNKDAQF